MSRCNKSRGSSEITIEYVPLQYVSLLVWCCNRIHPAAICISLFYIAHFCTSLTLKLQSSWFLFVVKVVFYFVKKLWNFWKLFMSFCKIVMWNCRMRNCKKVVKNCHKVCDFVKKSMCFCQKSNENLSKFTLEKSMWFCQMVFFLVKK